MQYCKVCGHETEYWGDIPFYKNNEQVKFVSREDYVLSYFICNNCNFLATYNFDAMDKAWFSSTIYNDEYIKVDPEYVEVRPKRVASWFKSKFRDTSLSILDYGAGSSKFGQLLAEDGYTVECWDPMWGDVPLPIKQFDLITCFEVFEHTPNPVETMKEIVSMLRPTGKLLFSTQVTDSVRPLTVDWWYFTPRGGHISHHSFRSLTLLCKAVGLKLNSYDAGMHEATYD
jgi:SAM-dependent methyltransferase